jgi:soluble lytic murein transglycosylase
LLQPLTNLRLGGAILAQLLARYAADPYAALAAYNAGEANAERWSARMLRGRPAAEVIPLVSYAETRQYVFQVLRHGGVYAACYGAPASPVPPGSSP